MRLRCPQNKRSSPTCSAHTSAASASACTLAQSVGQVIGPVIMGALYDVNHSGPFLANAFILILGSLLVWTLLTEPQPSARRLA